MKFITYGVHTRLHYLLERINGINEEMRINYLHDLYKIDKEILGRIYLYDIENLVVSNTVECVVEMLEYEVKTKSERVRFKGLDILDVLLDPNMLRDFLEFSKH